MPECLPVYEWYTKEKNTEICTDFLLWKDTDKMPRASVWAILKGHAPELWYKASCQLYGDFFFFFF